MSNSPNSNLVPLLLDKKSVLLLTSISHTTMYSLIARNQFPRPVKIPGTRRVAWKFSDIDKWVDDRQDAAFERAEAAYLAEPEAE